MLTVKTDTVVAQEAEVSCTGQRDPVQDTRTPQEVQGEEVMDRRQLVIAVPYDGVAPSHNGREREAFEDLVHLLLTYERIPATLCFYTAGVRWVTRESPLVEELREICARGADIVACHASMAEAGLLEELAVGRIDTADCIDDMLIDAQTAMVV